MSKDKPHGFCETPHQNCTMNYCDENGWSKKGWKKLKS